MSNNPYAPPTTPLMLEDTPLAADQYAGRFTRFASALVDGILMSAFTVPLMYLSGYYARIQLQQVSPVEQIAFSLLGIAVMLLLNGYLLATRGQTIGKMLTKIQIVDVQSGQLLPFIRVYGYRYLWLYPLVLIVAFIPGTMDDALVSIVALIDALLIFGGDRRCLHDYIAGSKVVLYQPNRPKIS
jgi:uncharacterized RDD family membrane protein YckC